MGRKWQINASDWKQISAELNMCHIMHSYTNFMAFVMVPFPSLLPHPTKPKPNEKGKDPDARCTSEVVGVHPIGGVGTRWSAGATQVTAATRKPMGIWVAPYGVSELPPYTTTQNRFMSISRWWFQTFFIFTPTWGNDANWLIFFKGVETTN